MTAKMWTSTVDVDSETNELFVEFPDEMMTLVQWNEGDTIRWEVDQRTQTCVLTKIDGEDK